MTTVQILTFILPATLHLIFAIYMIVKIKKTKILTPNQKYLNVLFTIIIPFIWSILVYYILKREPAFNDRKKLVSNSYEDSLLVTNLNNDNHN